MAVMDIGGCYDLPADEAMINIDADTIFVSVVIDAVLFNPTRV